MTIVSSTGPLPYVVRRRMRFISMTSSFLASAASTRSDGHIWIYRSQHHDMPTPFPSTVVSFKESSSKIKCPLPKMTPASPQENKLYKVSSSQPLSNDSLMEIYKIKAQFFRDQFNQRVSNIDADSRIQKRRVRSPHSLREADVTIYFPEKNVDDKPNSKLQGICLHVHGGGWLWGDSCHQVAHRCLEMAQHLNAAVVSVEYGLVCHDESFDPAGDTIAALEWIEYSGEEELGAHRALVASGESSGAHLLMLAMLHRRDDSNHDSPLRHAWKCLNLVYGVYDLSGTPSVCNDGDKSSPLCGNELLWLYELYRSRIQVRDFNYNDRKNASLSPLYANLSSLPSALVTVGTADPLLDDSLLLAEKYNSFRNDVEVALYEAGEHGIGHFGLQENEVMGERARRHTLDFMKRHLEK